jgi:hypothetical protein
MLNYTPPSPVQRSREYQRPLEEFWSSTVEGLIKKGDTIVSADKAGGLSSESEVRHTGACMPYGDYEWKSMRREGAIYIKSVSPEVTRRETVNFKVIARGRAYQDLNHDSVPAHFKDYRKGNVHLMYARHPEEVVMETDGTLEQEYFVMIAGELLRLHDSGI